MITQSPLSAYQGLLAGPQKGKNKMRTSKKIMSLNDLDYLQYLIQGGSSAKFPDDFKKHLNDVVVCLYKSKANVRGGGK